MLILTAAAAIGRDGMAEEKPFGLEKRIQWTTSNVKGWPDPPPPYTVEATFLEVNWERPVYAKAEPNSEHLWVVQQGGDLKHTNKAPLNSSKATKMKEFLT